VHLIIADKKFFDKLIFPINKFDDGNGNGWGSAND